MHLPRDEGATITRRQRRRINGVPSGQGLVEYALILVLVAIVASAPAVEGASSLALICTCGYTCICDDRRCRCRRCRCAFPPGQVCSVARPASNALSSLPRQTQVSPTSSAEPRTGWGSRSELIRWQLLFLFIGTLSAKEVQESFPEPLFDLRDRHTWGVGLCAGRRRLGCRRGLGHRRGRRRWFADRRGGLCRRLGVPQGSTTVNGFFDAGRAVFLAVFFAVLVGMTVSPFLGEWCLAWTINANKVGCICGSAIWFTSLFSRELRACARSKDGFEGLDRWR